jgi:hypothetical protein
MSQGLQKYFLRNNFGMTSKKKEGRNQERGIYMVWKAGDPRKKGM